MRGVGFEPTQAYASGSPRVLAPKPTAFDLASAVQQRPRPPPHRPAISLNPLSFISFFNSIRQA